jgi:probable phosphoglycerate mutase
METADPLAGVFQLPVCEEPGVIEVDYGAWLGGELKELAKQPDWHKVQHFPSTFRFPAGETLREVQQRAATALERIAAAHPNQVVAVVSHGDVIRTVLAHYMGTPLDLFQRLQISTASVSTLALFDGRPAILNLNVTTELPIFEIKPPEPPPAESEPVNQ